MRVGILGPLEVSENGRPLDVGPGRQRAVLLALLLRDGEIVSSDRLIDELWGDHPPPTAAKILQGHISHLRRVLPEGSIETRGSGYVLRPAESDRQEFEHLLATAREQRPRDAERTLRTALALWRGPALADVEYEPWAQSEIGRLDEVRQIAIEERLAALLELGDHVRAVPELEGLIAQHPLRERLHALLMLALYRSGRQADALEAYARARAKLIEELGIEPAPELRELQRRILEQDAELAPPLSPLQRAARRAPGLVIAGGLILAASAVAAGFLLTRSSSGGSLLAVPNSLGVIDPASNKVTRVIPVGETPTSVAVAGGAVWVLNSSEETVSQIDATRGAVVRTLGSGTAPTMLAVGAGAVWVSGAAHTLRRLDPDSGTSGTLPIPRVVGPRADFESSWVAGDGTAVWAANDMTVSRLSPRPRVITVPTTVNCCGALAIGAGSVWTTDALGLLQLDGHTGKRLARIPLAFLDAGGPGARALAVGYGSVWVVDENGSTVWRIDARTDRLVGTISVGTNPTGVAAGAGAVWVASSDGTVARIDPSAAQGIGKVVRTIRVGGTPDGVAVGDGMVWVTVD